MNYSFSGHAFRRMAERGFSPDIIKNVIENGCVIKEYPDDKPYPSRLILGFYENRPIHIVCTYNQYDKTEYIITVYEPDTELWTEDFKSRRKK